MNKLIPVIFLLMLSPQRIDAQSSFGWETTKDGILRDGEPFFMNGQSWSKKTDFTYQKGASAEGEVKEKLSELHEIGVNTIRIYGSPDESDWDGSSNFHNLIRWIEDWNDGNPDGGDPNKAMYYMVQISPKDPQSSLSGNLPENTSSSFQRAINDESNPGSVASMVKYINQVTSGSKYLIAYLIYHELNVSSKYIDWFEHVGAEGVEGFMNETAAAIHNDLAPGKLVSHTGDSKEPDTDIYESIEALDATDGNVFSNFDMLGFNLYISTDALLKRNTYYYRIVKRRALSVNNERGWFIGETGVSYDKEANPNSVAAANYTNPQGGANLHLMWHLSEEHGNMIGFMLFTVQDNDKLETVNLDAMKQRGYYDFYGDRKFLYYIYSDVINQISTNDRFHSTFEHDIGVSIVDDGSQYSITYLFKNKTGSEKQFLWSIYGDDAGKSKQRFSVEVAEEYHTVQPRSESSVVRIVPKPSSNNLLAIAAMVIDDLNPTNSYLWSREHTFDDAISTVAGLNLYSDNLPDYESKVVTSASQIDNLFQDQPDFIKGLLINHQNQVIRIPNGSWELRVFTPSGVSLFNGIVKSSPNIELHKLISYRRQGFLIYTLLRH